MIASLESVAKIGLYSALLLVLGSHAARWLLRSIRAQIVRADAADDRLARVALVAGTALIACLLFRLWAHTVLSFGVSDGSTWENLSLIGLESRWGAHWRVQTSAAVVSLLVCAWTIGRRPWSLLVSTAVALVLAGTFPLTGHAAGQPFRVAIDVAHLLGGGLWLGTLAVLLIVKPQGPVFEHFSPLALTGSTVVVSTGLIMAWLYLGAIDNLWATTYGRLLVAKVVTVLAISACGFVNWQRARAGQAPPAASLEAALALAVVVVTAFLTETAHP